ncbi:MAG: ATP-dependent sacrificial sulfur transferase LarE [Bacteroidales bacterium]
MEEARSLCKSFGIEHLTINLPVPESIMNNPKERCYLCKKVLFSRISDYAAEAGCNIVADGTNADDKGTHRPGMRALEEMKIMSPLMIAGFTKADIRSLLQEYDLEIWNKPAYACLLTRVPYNTYIDTRMLHIIELSEKYIHSIGYPGTRVRLHGDIARIECMPESLDEMLTREVRNQVTTYLKSLGIKYITIDLEGYRTGSMDL